MTDHHTPPTPQAMESAPENALESAFETAFDTALRQHLHSDPELADDGFTQSVMAALPPRAAHSPIRWHQRAAYARWTALSFGACAAAALLSGGNGPVDLAQGAAAYALIGLLVFWSIPSRFSQG